MNTLYRRLRCKPTLISVTKCPLALLPSINSTFVRKHCRPRTNDLIFSLQHLSRTCFPELPCTIPLHSITHLPYLFALNRFFCDCGAGSSGVLCKLISEKFWSLSSRAQIVRMVSGVDTEARGQEDIGNQAVCLS